MTAPQHQINREMIVPLCRDCRFFEQRKAPPGASRLPVENEGLCRRHAPKASGGRHAMRADWPSVSKLYDWCGEFEPVSEVPRHLRDVENNPIADGFTR